MVISIEGPYKTEGDNQISESIPFSDPMVIEEAEEDVASNLHVNFKKRQQKRLSKNIQPVFAPPSSKRRRPSFEKGASFNPSLSTDTTPVIVSHTLPPL